MTEKKKGKSPAFQLYVKDWLASAHITMMTPEQEGGYIRLLAHCWNSGDCSLPDSDEELAVLSRLGERWLNGGSTLVRKCFIQHPTKAGCLTNERLLEEAVKQKDWSEKSRAAGIASGLARAGKKVKRTKKEPLLNGGSDLVEPKGNSSSSSSSAIDSEVTTVTSSSAVAKAPSGTKAFPKSFNLWLERNNVGDMTTHEAYEHWLKNVNRRGTRWEEKKIPQEFMDYAITKAWPQAFALKVYDQFQNYWMAKAGQDGVKLDWLATWRNWTIKEEERNGKPTGKTAGRSLAEQDYHGGTSGFKTAGS